MSSMPGTAEQYGVHGSAGTGFEYGQGGTVFGVVILDAVDFNREQLALPRDQRQLKWHRTDLLEFATAEARTRFLERQSPGERLLLVERVQPSWTITAGWPEASE